MTVREAILRLVGAPEPVATGELSGRVGPESVALATGLRGDVRRRVQEVVELSEQGVLAAGASLRRVVDASSTQITTLKGFLDAFSHGERNEMNLVQRFVTAVEERLEAQTGFATASARLSNDIAEAAQGIQALTTHSRMVAMNARIEASRVGPAGAGFAVIAGEMKRMAEEIAEANRRIQALASEMAQLAPGIEGAVVALKDETRAFSSRLSDEIARTTEASRATETLVSEVLASTDASLSSVVQASQEGLSHLQFQDVVAQGLLRLDARLLDHQRSIARLTGVDATRFEPAVYHELGGEKAVSGERAGDVVLF